jgi:hypothetical protein
MPFGHESTSHLVRARGPIAPTNGRRRGYRELIDATGLKPSCAVACRLGERLRHTLPKAERRLQMPAKTEKQRRFMGAELERKREGKKTRTDMSESELEKMASKPEKKKDS